MVKIRYIPFIFVAALAALLPASCRKEAAPAEAETVTLSVRIDAPDAGNGGKEAR